MTGPSDIAIASCAANNELYGILCRRMPIEHARTIMRDLWNAGCIAVPYDQWAASQRLANAVREIAKTESDDGR